MSKTVTPEAGIAGLGARVHLFIRSERREAFISLFRDILRCELVELEFGLEHPILLVSFPDGSAFSVEFSELAPDVEPGPTANDESAPRGAWIEFRARGVDQLHDALRAGGVPEFRHPGSLHAYFIAPGGQVFRLLDVAYRGP